MNISQVEIRLINIDQAKEFLTRIPIASVKLSEILSHLIYFLIKYIYLFSLINPEFIILQIK